MNIDVTCLMKKLLLILKYLGKELIWNLKLSKKPSKVGVKEVYLGKVVDNATHIICFAKWNSSKVDKKKEEIERKIPNEGYSNETFNSYLIFHK